MIPKSVVRARAGSRHCHSVRDCFAVVTATTAMLASLVVLASPAAASPGAWSINPTPNAVSPQNNHLSGVSCASASFCVAAGYYSNGTVDQNLLLSWNGSTWSLNSAASLSTSASQKNHLTSVSCASSSFCVAAGYYNNGTVDQNLLLTWNGSTWSLNSAASLSTSSSQNNHLSGVSCASASFCVAAGYYSNGTVDQNLLLSWNGSTWSLNSAASLSTSASQNNNLSGVSCASSSFCVASGYYSNGTVDQNLFLTWNGSSWSLNSAASFSTSASQDNHLSGVSCASASFCVAAGYYRGHYAILNLLLTWNGSTWSLNSAASLSAKTMLSNYLTSVSCVSANFCVAAGYYLTQSFTVWTQNLLLTWNGSSWSLNSAASLSTSASVGNGLLGISCVSARSCVAAGYYDSSGVFQNLVLTWNGSGWSLDAAASLSATTMLRNHLTSV
ncbi:MAG: hypothetical protein ACYDEY_02670 [Acidimicrobiales bacterium]